MAEIPRECTLETFLLKQTDSVLGFFLSFVYSIAPHNELVHNHIPNRFPQKVFLSKRQILQTQQSYGNSSAEWIYCFLNGNKKGLFFNGGILPTCPLPRKPTFGEAAARSAVAKLAVKSRTRGHSCTRAQSRCEIRTAPVHEILTETTAGEMVKGKNCPYMAISFDARLVNSPFFIRHIIICLICQIWYLTTLSLEHLTNPRKVCLVNHKERWQVSQISSVVKRREA